MYNVHNAEQTILQTNVSEHFFSSCDSTFLQLKRNGSEKKSCERVPLNPRSECL